MTGILRRSTSILAVRGAFERLVDADFAAHATTLARAFDIAAGSRLDLLLNQMLDEAIVLMEQGQYLRADHPLARAASDELLRHLRRAQRGIQPAAMRLTGNAARNAGQLARLITLGTGGRGALRLGWNEPSEEALRALMDYTSSPVWGMWVDRFAPGMADRVQRVIVREFTQGRNPIAAARTVRRMMQTLPRANAVRMLRTLQLTALRDGMALDYAANADILTGTIRISTFDNRVCPACIALHGTRLAPGERVDDHYNGRCVAVGEVRGRPRNIESGADWLRRQAPERVYAILGREAGDAFLRGAVRLDDYVGVRHDPLFGRQIVARRIR